MNSLQTLLAGGWKEYLPYIGIGLAVAILLGVLIKGAVKGVFRVGKFGITWAIAGGGFIGLYYFWTKKGLKNPIESMFKKGFLHDNASLVWALTLAVGIVLVVMVLRALLGLIFKKEIQPKAAAAENSEELEYELDDVVEGYYGRPKSKYEKNRESSPGIVSRILGSILALVNFAIGLAIVAGVVLFFIDALKIAGGLGGLLGDVGSMLSKKAMPYFLDFITVGIIFGIGCHGFYTGTIGFTRILLVKFGTIAVVVLSMAAPFVKPLSEIALVSGLSVRCADVLAGVKFLASFNLIAGKVLAGIVMALVGVLIMLVLNIVLKKLIEVIEGTCVLRIIDGILATAIYLTLAVLLCLVLWSLFYALNAFGIFRVEGLLLENTLSHECFNGGSYFIGDIIDAIMSLFKKK